MQFVISKETLSGPLRLITGVVDRKQTLPIIGNLLLEIRNNQLSMVATNLEVELKTQQPLSIEAPDIRTTIPARKLNDIVKSLPDETVIECELTDGQLNMHTSVTDFSLTVLPADDFPLMKDPAIQEPEIRFTVNQKELQHTIEKCSFSMALQDVRYFLNGMLLEVEGDTLTMVTTDGHRLSLSKVGINYSGDKKRVIIPRKGIFELVRILEEEDTSLEVTIQSNTVKIKTKKVEFQSKLIDGEYPNYQSVVPQQPQNHFHTDTHSFIDALDRTGIILNDKPRGSKMMLEAGKVTLVTTNSLGEKSSEKVDADYQGAAFDLGFNTDYLIDAFSRLETAQARVSFNDPNESCLIEEVNGDRSSFVIMSMKV